MRLRRFRFCPRRSQPEARQRVDDLERSHRHGDYPADEVEDVCRIVVLDGPVIGIVADAGCLVGAHPIGLHRDGRLAAARTTELLWGTVREEELPERRAIPLEGLRRELDERSLTRGPVAPLPGHAGGRSSTDQSLR